MSGDSHIRALRAGANVATSSSRYGDQSVGSEGNDASSAALLSMLECSSCLVISKGERGRWSYSNDETRKECSLFQNSSKETATSRTIGPETMTSRSSC